MQSLRNGHHASAVWLDTLSRILADGKEVSPRGMRTLELLHNTFTMNMSYPVVLCPGRQLSYKFLAAEALWILEGDDRVATIAPYNQNIARFSDDGDVFFGAYGPRIASQFDYVVRKLLEDRDTRQAVLTIWKENPPKTKDVPCTVAISFSIRASLLHCHVFMRSSDAWLGLPYDCFNFTMLALKVACAYNQRDSRAGISPVGLGWLNLTMASSHLYENNWDGAKLCIEQNESPLGIELPNKRLLAGDWPFFGRSLQACRDKVESLYWRIRP